MQRRKERNGKDWRREEVDGWMNGILGGKELRWNSRLKQKISVLLHGGLKNDYFCAFITTVPELSFANLMDTTYSIYIHIYHLFLFS